MYLRSICIYEAKLCNLNMNMGTYLLNILYGHCLFFNKCALPKKDTWLSLEAALSQGQMHGVQGEKPKEVGFVGDSVITGMNQKLEERSTCMSPWLTSSPLTAREQDPWGLPLHPLLDLLAEAPGWQYSVHISWGFLVDQIKSLPFQQMKMLTTWHSWAHSPRPLGA